jgi:hypothetical protein
LEPATIVNSGLRLLLQKKLDPPFFLNHEKIFKTILKLCSVQVASCAKYVGPAKDASIGQHALVELRPSARRQGTAQVDALIV